MAVTFWCQKWDVESIQHPVIRTILTIEMSASKPEVQQMRGNGSALEGYWSDGGGQDVEKVLRNLEDPGGNVFEGKDAKHEALVLPVKQDDFTPIISGIQQDIKMMVNQENRMSDDIYRNFSMLQHIIAGINDLSRTVTQIQMQQAEIWLQKTSKVIEKNQVSDQNYILTNSCTCKCNHHARSVKMETFDGKEKWTVWWKRFNIATSGWSDDDKLKQMLLLMRGNAADFVFDQLPEDVLSSYESLIIELKNRYHKVESPDMYTSLFCNRDQMDGESGQDYAIELTMLYRKAHPNRGQTVRDEDVLQRWLEGLNDRVAAEQIQFVKAPKSLQEAVSALVTYESINSHDKAASIQEKMKSASPTIEAEMHNQTDPSQQRTRQQTTGHHYLCNGKSKQMQIDPNQVKHCSNRSKSRGTLICYKCRVPNHVARNCSKAIQDASTAFASLICKTSPQQRPVGVQKHSIQQKQHSKI